LRFAVHRPGIPEASLRSHGVPRRDVPGRVHISVEREVAGHAGEEGLALAALCCDVPARAAALRGVRRFDLLHPFAGLVFQSTYQQAPARSQDFPVQSGLGPDIAAGLVTCTLCRAGHVADKQVLDADHVELAGQPGARLLHPVFALVCLAGLQLGNRMPHAPTAVRPALSAGELALKPQDTCSLWPGQARNAHQFSRGKGSAGRHASVDADDFAVARCRERVRYGGERDMPPACAIQLDPVGLHARRYCTGPAKPYPANFWDPNLAHITGYTAHIPLPAAANNSESLVPPGFPPRRTPGWISRIKEGRHCLSEVTQSLLLYRLGTCGQPRVRRTGSGELAALLQIARSAHTALVPVRVLLDRQVPHEPGVGTMVPQYHLLGWRGVQPVPVHTNTLATTTDISWAVKWCCRPWLKGVDPLPRPPTLPFAVLSGQPSAREREAPARMANK
jgi:hypothetical protein